MVAYWAILKNMLWQLLGKVGPLFTLTSGHTDLDQTERGEGGFGSTRSDQDGAHCLRVITAKSKCFKT